MNPLSSAFKPRLSLLGMAVFAAAGFSGGTLLGESLMQGLEHETQAIISRTQDAVVQIKTIVPVTDPGSGKELGEGLSVGTGFFADNQGHILTAASVLHGEKKAVAYWRGKTFEAQCIGQDPRTNIALLKVEANATALPFGDPEAVKTGSMAMIVGLPSEGPITAEFGNISDPHSMNVSLNLPQLATSNEIHSCVPLFRAAIHVYPGQSGSPFLNVKGEVVGMLVYASADGATAFAIPMTAIRKIQRDFEQFHAPRYGWTGMTTEFMLGDVKNDQKQVTVRGVFVGSPANLAEIEPGDSLKKIGNQEIQTPADLMNATFYLSVGDTIKVTIEHDGETESHSLKVIERPADHELAAMKLLPAPTTGPH